MSLVSDLYGVVTSRKVAAELIKNIYFGVYFIYTTYITCTYVTLRLGETLKPLIYIATFFVCPLSLASHRTWFIEVSPYWKVVTVVETLSYLVLYSTKSLFIMAHEDGIKRVYIFFLCSCCIV